MDSLTQVLLGAAVGRLAAPSAGRRAIVIGAAAGLLPDLDILTSPFLSDVEAFTTHRSASHSFLVLPLAALLLAYALSRIRGGFGLSFGRWLWLLLLCFGTHVLLDLCTNYGTQIFWPASRYPYAWSTVFIVDPFYSLTLLVGLIVAWRGRSPGLGRNALIVSLAVSTAYLLAGAAFKVNAAGAFASELAARGIPAQKFRVQNTPFNIFLWEAVVVGDRFTANGYCLHPCEPDAIEFRILPFNGHRAAVEAWLPEFGELRSLAEFSGGFYRIREIDGDIVWVDMRFGSGDVRPFVFKIGRAGGSGPERTDDPVVRVELGGPEELRKEFGAFLSRWR